MVSGTYNVHRVKLIRELRDFEIRHLNMLVGAKDTGGFNFISLFVFLNHLVDRRPQGYAAQSGGIDFFPNFGRKITNELDIAFEDS